MNMYIKPLIQKDWYLQRYLILGYLIIGLLTLGIVGIPSELWFAVGSIGLITVLISLGIHLIMTSVIEERTLQTLPFIMSLPISVREYTTSKILANLLIYLVPWLGLLIASYVLILTRETLPDGLIPFVTMILLEILMGFCLILAVALMTESQSWTIAAVVLGNLMLQGFMAFISNLPSISSTIRGSSIVWDSTSILIIAAELMVMLVLLAVTFYVQFKKTDFI